MSSIPLPASAAIRKCRKQRGRALNQNNNRPTQGNVDIIHARTVSRVIRYMDPRVGNLSWVSHATIAKDVGIRREAIHYHLLAATLIGELRVRYHTATAAHLQISQRYPHYTEYTGGQTFTEMLGEQPGKPKRLNYYTIHKCMGCPSYHGQALPDWQIEIIKLCATQKAGKVRQAKEIARQHQADLERGVESPPKPSWVSIRQKLQTQRQAEQAGQPIITIEEIEERPAASRSRPKRCGTPHRRLPLSHLGRATQAVRRTAQNLSSYQRRRATPEG